MADSSKLPWAAGRFSDALQLRAYLAAFVRGDYARAFFRSVGLQTLSVIALIEAIFLAEHFTWVFRDAARHEANLLDIALVLLCSGTGIFDLALAISVLIAVYAGLVQMRERRELLVLFASGLGPYQLSVLILILALVAQIVGIVGSGLVDPLSKYAQRSILYSAELSSLKKGVAQGEFYYFPGYVAYATQHATDGNDPQPLGSPKSSVGLPDVIDQRPAAQQVRDRTLFIYQQIGPNASRVITAAYARLDGPDPSGKITLSLGDFTSHTFEGALPLTSSDPSSGHTVESPCGKCTDDLKDLPNITMNVHDMYQLMMVQQLLPFDARGGGDPEELTIFEQFHTPADQPMKARKLQMRLLAERFSRSLLSFLAPLLALAALCLTSRRTNWFILPAACLSLMSVYLVSEWLITVVTPRYVAAALIPPIFLTALVAWGALSLVFRRPDEIGRPRLGQG